METKRMGRPPKAQKEINPVRQIGRWPDDQWELIQTAAERSGKSVAQWAREILLRAAKRRQAERRGIEPNP
jgi:uncharacterized protein (DUF1778 family)